MSGVERGLSGFEWGLSGVERGLSEGLSEATRSQAGVPSGHARTERNTRSAPTEERRGWLVPLVCWKAASRRAPPVGEQGGDSYSGRPV